MANRLLERRFGKTSNDGRINRVIEMKQCDNCGLDARYGKYWRTGYFLCSICYDKWMNEENQERKKLNKIIL